MQEGCTSITINVLFIAQTSIDADTSNIADS